LRYENQEPGNKKQETRAKNKEKRKSSTVTRPGVLPAAGK